jgi:hypothetical protein
MNLSVSWLGECRAVAVIWVLTCKLVSAPVSVAIATFFIAPNKQRGCCLRCPCFLTERASSDPKTDKAEPARHAQDRLLAILYSYLYDSTGLNHSIVSFVLQTNPKSRIAHL